MNLKAWCAAAMLAVGSFFGAHAEDLQFSTVENPVWYQIKFTNGGWALSDPGQGSVLKTASSNANAEAQQWQFIGNADECQIRSAKGNYVSFSDTRFRSASSATKCYIALTGTRYEIGRVGSDYRMNMWGGAGSGKEIGEYDAGDNGNGLKIYTLSGVEVSLPGTLPVFSNEGNEVWYFINFLKGGCILASDGVGKSCLRARAMPNGKCIWKVTGSADNAQFVNQDGEYLVISGTGDGCVKAGNSAQSGGYSIVATGNAEYPQSWEIKPNEANYSNGQNYINQFGGTDIGGKFGLWTYGDPNNVVQFVPENSMEYGEVSYEPSTTFKPEEPLTLWFTRPGTTATNTHQWMDLGLPIGNGQLGAMILGGIAKEDISVNEKTLWTGDTELRGSYSYGCYQNFGSLYVRSREEGIGYEVPVKNYWRDLDLTTGIARVHYENADGVSFDRKYIASYPDNVVAALFTTSKSGALSLNFEEVPGMAKNHEVSYSFNGNTATIEYHGKFEIISYCSVIKITPAGANATIALAADGKSVDVKNADSVYVTIAAGTDYDAVAPSYTSGTDELQGKIENIAAAAMTKGWDAVVADQVPEHEKFFSRVNFTLEGAENTLPTDEARAKYAQLTSSSINSKNEIVKMMEILYFQYGRYLEIGSSRGVDLPGNLQGIWSGYNVYVPHASGQVAPWNADIHTNINVQMCYWPCEPTNLSELHLPFLNYIINQATIQPQWRDFAKNVTTPGATDPDAWTCAVENNIFGGMGSYDTRYSVANAWYCTHLWQHYAYTLDKDFLNRALPTMWGATKFWLERMVLASDGTYECPSESSPEHGPNQNAVAHAQQIVAELFANMLDALEALPEQTLVDAEGLALLQDRYAKMDKGIAIEQFKTSSGWTANGLKNGDDMLREWKYADYTAGQDGHRHISHLMCLYPYSQLVPGTREYNAAVNSLKQRGDGATGWSIGWKVNLWARAKDGNHARQILRNGISNNAYNNLFDSHAPFQIDGNFGCTTGIAEMFVQSLGNTLWVMPALPTLWADGEMTGLKAVGDFTVDLKWADKKIELATITANQGGTLNLGNKDLIHTRIAVNGTAIEPMITDDEATGNVTTVIADLKAGDKVTLVYDAEYTQPNVNGESAIEEVEVPSNMIITASNGYVAVGGAEVAALNVYDTAGRQLAATNKSFVKVDATGIVLVKATDVEGKTVTAKVTL